MRKNNQKKLPPPKAAIEERYEQMRLQGEISPASKNLISPPPSLPTVNPTEIAKSPFCQAKDLKAEWGKMQPISGGGMTGYIVITKNNISPCILQGVPQLELINNQKKKISLSQNLFNIIDQDKKILLDSTTQAEILLEWTDSLKDLEPKKLCPILETSDTNMNIILPNGYGIVPVIKQKDQTFFIGRICGSLAVSAFTKME